MVKGSAFRVVAEPGVELAGHTRRNLTVERLPWVGGLRHRPPHYRQLFKKDCIQVLSAGNVFKLYFLTIRVNRAT